MILLLPINITYQRLDLILLSIYINYVLSWYKMMNIEILHFEQIQIRRIKTKNRNKEYTELRDFVSQKFFALDLNKFNYLR